MHFGFITGCRWVDKRYVCGKALAGWSNKRLWYRQKPADIWLTVNIWPNYILNMTYTELRDEYPSNDLNEEI